MSFSAVIQAELVAKSSQFKAELNNANTAVDKLEANLQRAGVMPLPGEKSAKQSAKAIEEVMRAEERLQQTRGERLYQEADTLGRIRILSEELRSIAQQRDAAEAGTAEKINLQVAAEQKLAQIRSLRGRAQSERVAGMDGLSAATAQANSVAAAARARAESAALARASAGSVASAQARYAAEAAAEESAINAQIRAREAQQPPAPGSRGLRQRFTDWRKGAMKSLGDVGGSDLVKGLGIGALAMGFRAALTNAQDLRDEAYAIGKALDPATERTAEIADTLDRAKQGAMGMVASLLSFVQGGVDHAVAGVSALFGMGTYDENMKAISTQTQAQRSHQQGIAMAKERKKAEDEVKRAQAELADAEISVADARIAAAKAAGDTEEKIRIGTLEVADAQEAVNETKEGTIERAKAELELVQKQADLADLQRDRAKELGDAKKAQADDEKKATEERIRAQEKLQAALDKEVLARARLASAQKALAAGLADQSAASLSEVEAGERGSPEDRRKAEEVARLRQRARDARDAGRSVLVGGEAVSVADQLSSRANQVQSGIQSLNTAERNPLASLEAAVAQSNEELAQIRESLAIMEVEQ